jgi:hypothetical protein
VSANAYVAQHSARESRVSGGARPFESVARSCVESVGIRTDGLGAGCSMAFREIEGR